ncbi:MAG: hypothetical protein H0V42_00785 [Nocardioidaceae bacterium]|nr:hypothetical protein [Nocardioidaceae bacterium]
MKTHPLNVSYLVIGLVFLGVAGSWALQAGGVIDTSDVQWLVPLSLVVAGAIGLVAFAAKGISRSPSHDRANSTDTDTIQIEGEHR